MVKRFEVRVTCPRCGLGQTYHSHNKSTRGKRRKKCNRCGHQFSVKGAETENIREDRERLPSDFRPASSVD